MGTKLTLDLSASDPDGDPLSYSVLELPLPDGAYLDGYSGQFTFTPDPEHVGTIDLTFTVSDGALSDQETVTFTIPAIDGTASTRFSGRLLDANDYANGITTPIVGATVSFLNNGPAAVSDAQGYISLDSLAAGTQVLDIDPSGAQDSPAGGPYGGFREQYLLYEHVDNLQERPFFLPRIDLDSVTQVDPALETVVTNSSLGVSIVVPPHTAKTRTAATIAGRCPSPWCRRASLRPPCRKSSASGRWSRSSRWVLPLPPRCRSPFLIVITWSLDTKSKSGPSTRKWASLLSSAPAKSAPTA